MDTLVISAAQTWKISSQFRRTGRKTYNTFRMGVCICAAELPPRRTQSVRRSPILTLYGEPEIGVLDSALK